jgi:hypothetical protein
MIAIRRPPVKPHWESRISFLKSARILARTMSPSASTPFTLIAPAISALASALRNCTGWTAYRTNFKTSGPDGGPIVNQSESDISKLTLQEKPSSAVIGFLFSLPARRGVSLAVLWKECATVLGNRRLAHVVQLLVEFRFSARRLRLAGQNRSRIAFRSGRGPIPLPQARRQRLRRSSITATRIAAKRKALENMGKGRHDKVTTQNLLFRKMPARQ